MFMGHLFAIRYIKKESSSCDVGKEAFPETSQKHHTKSTPTNSLKVHHYLNPHFFTNLHP